MKKNITGVVKRIEKALRFPEILVINDCSFDKTLRVARSARAIVINLP